MLNQDRLNAYLGKKREERPQFALLSQEQANEMLSITRSGVPALAAIMNFGIYPQGCLPQLCVTAIVVPGKQIGEQAEDSARFMDNKRIEGTISPLLELGKLAMTLPNKPQSKNRRFYSVNER